MTSKNKSLEVCSLSVLFLFVLLVLTEKNSIGSLSWPIHWEATHQKAVEEVCGYHGRKWTCICGLICECNSDREWDFHNHWLDLGISNFSEVQNRAKFPAPFFRLESVGGTEQVWFSAGARSGRGGLSRISGGRPGMTLLVTCGCV